MSDLGLVVAMSDLGLVVGGVIALLLSRKLVGSGFLAPLSPSPSPVGEGNVNDNSIACRPHDGAPVATTTSSNRATRALAGARSTRALARANGWEAL